MRYIEVPKAFSSQALCSDDSCPCGSPGAVIRPGEGYIYVSREVAEFRSDALTVAQAEAKIQRMAARMGAMIFAASGVFAPILMCRQGAEKRGLNLSVAGADAQHWWETGLVPLRPTPLEGQSESDSSLHIPEWGDADYVPTATDNAESEEWSEEDLEIARNVGLGCAALIALVIVFVLVRNWLFPQPAEPPNPAEAPPASAPPWSESRPTPR